MAEMSAASAAEVLDGLNNGLLSGRTTEALNCAASILRQVASGEMRELVHGEWTADEFGHKCSVCGEYVGDDTYENECLTYCPNCGNLMGGKDGTK